MVIKQLKIPQYLMAFLGIAICSQVIAKELYVSTQGDDSLSKDQVSISSPWKSITKGIYNLQAGDTLYIRGGFYTPKYPLLLRSDYANRTYGGDPSIEMNSESGTVSNPVTITSYQNETVVIDASEVAPFVTLDNKSYWVFKNIEVINSQTAFAVGVNGESPHNTFDNIKITASRGGDNSANIKLNSDSADYTTIKNCTLTGPGTGSSIHANTSAIYARKMNNLTVENNILRNVPIGLYFKHANAAANAASVNISISNNFVYNTSRNSMQINANYAVIANNIFGKNNNGLSNNEANGVPGGDYNIYDHNTFYSGGIGFNSSTQSGDSLPGSIGNTFSNNLVFDTVGLNQYADYDHKTKSDHNLYIGGIDIIYENRVSYGLSAWREKSSTDVNSIQGSVDFIELGEANAVSNFALSAQSSGYKAGTDGKNIGADTNNVGPQVNVTSLAGISPNAPANLSVEKL